MMGMTSRDILFMMRARDYASREVRNLGGAFGALGKAIQKVDQQLAQNLNKSFENQNRLIAESKARNERFAKAIDSRINESLRRQKRALSDASVASQRYNQNMANNAHLTRMVETSHRDYARTVTQANKQIETAAQQARIDAARRFADDTYMHRAQKGQLQARNALLNSMDKAMRANTLTQARANTFAQEELRLYEQSAPLTYKRIKELQGITEAQRAEMMVKRQAYNTQKKLTESLEAGRITQQEYAKRRAQLWAAEKARNSERIGEINREIAARRAQLAEQRNVINETANAQKAANNRAIAANRLAADARITELQRERQALMDHHAKHQRLIGEREARQRGWLENSKRMYGENSRTHQQMLRQAGETERQQHEANAERQRQAIQQYQRKIMALQAVGLAATIAGAALLALGRRGIRSLTQLTTASMEFRHGMALAMTQIQDDTPATIEGLVEIGRVVGNEIPAAMETMGSTMFFIFSSLNADVPTAQKLLRGFAREAVAGNTDIESAARSTIAILNGMNMEFSDLTRVQDFQFQTVRRGVITYEQLSQNIGKLIPALSRSGQEIETGGAMLAFLTRQGLSAEMATTAAARSLELLASPRVITRLEDMGIAMRDARGEFLPLIDILRGMNDQIGHLSAPGKVEAMWEMFSGAGYRIQARRFFDTVFNNFERFEWHIDQQLNNAGAMQRAYEIMFAEPQNQVQLLRNQVETLRQEFGDRLIPIIRQLVDVGQRFINWLRELDESTKDGIVRFMAFATAAATLSGGLMVLGGMFTVILSLVRPLVSSMGMAFGIVAGGPVVIMALVTALIAAVVYWDRLSESISNAIEWLKTAEGSVFAMIIAVGGLAYATRVIRNFITTIQLLGGAFVVAKMKVVAFSNAVKAAFIKSGPIGWAIIALGALATAFVALRTEARRTNEGIKEYADVQIEVGNAIDESEHNFLNYANAMQRSRREVARSRIANEELGDSIRALGMSERDFVNVLSGSIREQLNLRDELDRRLTDLMGVNTQEAHNQRVALQAVSRELNISIEASREAERQVESEMRARGGLSAVIADYINLMGLSNDVQRLNNDAARLQEARLRNVIITTLELQHEMGMLDEELLEVAMSLGMIDEELEYLNESIEEASRAAEGLSQVFGNLTDATSAWNAALEAINEDREDPFESLLDAPDAINLWIDALNDGVDETRSLFGNMATIIANNSDVMIDDISLVIGAVMDMGDAGPEAMALLASADPDKFLEVLRVIRLNAALTSDEVRDNIDEMIRSINSILERRGPEFADLMDEILEATVLTVERNADRVDGNIEEMMDAVLYYIDTYGELSVEEMQAVMTGVLSVAERDGKLTSAHIEDMMSLMQTYIEAGGDIIEGDFAGIMAVLAEAAKNGGEISVENLADALRMAPDEVRAIAELAGIAFTEGVEEGMDARRTVEYFQRNLERQEHLLNSMGYNAGRNVSTGIQRGLNSVSLSAPSIRYTAPSGRTNTLEPTPQNSGGLIPGGGPDRDSVLAFLTTGEYVIRRKAVQAVGTDFLDSLNALNSGGSVGFNTGTSTPSVSMPGGIPIGWMDQFGSKYANVIKSATEANIQATRDMMSAVSAMQAQHTAQWALSDARTNLENVHATMRDLEKQAIEANAQLARAWENAKQVTAEQELAIIRAQQGVRQAEQVYAEFTNGTRELNQELAELRQMERINQLKASLESISNTDYSNIKDLELAASEASARYTRAKAEMQQVERLLPTVQDEVQALLMQYKAENELNDALKEKNRISKELQDAHSTLTGNTSELRIAQIELALAEQELSDIRKRRSWEDEEYRIAQLNLKTAQESLTQAHKDSVGPTDEVREAQERLRQVKEQQAAMSGTLEQAERDLIQAELGVINSTLGMIDAGSRLVEHGPAQFKFFREIASTAGMSKASVDNLIKSLRELQAVSKAAGTSTGSSAPSASSSSSSPAPSTSTNTSSRTYTVRSGDSLWAIASRLYGNGNDWRKLYDMNRSVIGSNPNLIFPGQVLKYDNGGILRPGWTLAYNGTAQNEYITRKEPDSHSMVIESGAINITVEGDADANKIRQAVEAMLQEIYDEVRS